MNFHTVSHFQSNYPDWIKKVRYFEKREAVRKTQVWNVSEKNMLDPLDLSLWCTPIVFICVYRTTIRQRTFILLKQVLAYHQRYAYHRLWINFLDMCNLIIRDSWDPFLALLHWLNQDIDMHNIGQIWPKEPVNLPNKSTK